MKSTVRHLTLISLFLLCAVYGNAEKSPVTHNFASMSIPSQIAFSNGNQTAETNLLTYTCSGGAKFGKANNEGTYLSANFSSDDDMVTTTKVDSLAGVEIYYYPSTMKCKNIQLYLSRDSVHWSQAILTDAMYDINGHIRASFVPGAYYVRLTSNSSQKVAMWEIRYRFGGCNCMLYIPEE